MFSKCLTRIETVAVASPETLFEEISDYFAARMTPEEIIAFKPSEALDERLHELLDKNSENTLTREERAELDRFLQVNHLLTLLKAKARLKLAEQK
jgi:hypothetical protein